jgi:hypothetical protein
MATKPALPADEEPLDAATIDRFLSNMGPDMVLVGGQALAFWMDRFGIAVEDAAISNDGDALGSVALARDVALAMEAKLIVPAKASRTALVAQLRLPVARGKMRNIDVLHMLYTIGGPSKSSAFTKRVVRDSVEAEWREGRLIRVMDPFDVLESRSHNAVGLHGEKGPHVLTQAKWAIEVARAALLKLAADPKATQRLGGQIQRIYALARSQVGKRLWSEHQTELLGAIDIEALSRAAPMHARQLEAVRRAIEDRRSSARKSATARKSGKRS